MLLFGKESIMSKFNKITHITSVHKRYDSRIFLKQCTSLAKKKFYEVNLIVADSLGDEIKNNVNIYDIGIYKNRIQRMRKGSKDIFSMASKIDSDIYHIHDPELIYVGLKLKFLGKKVIFDSHEDVGQDIMVKKWIPYPLRYVTSILYQVFESFSCRFFDGIVVPTDYIENKFSKINNNVTKLYNFPIIPTNKKQKVLWEEKDDAVCYVGGISEIRGVREMVIAINLLDKIKLNLIGFFFDRELEKKIKIENKWDKIHEFGFLNQDEVFRVLNKSKAGLVVLHPTTPYKSALPIKMFEYMLAGIPVICSDINLWAKIINENNCGIAVNPLNPKKIAEAIQYIINNPIESEKMGRNGQNAIYMKYNWSSEEKKLMDKYSLLLS